MSEFNEYMKKYRKNHPEYAVRQNAQAAARRAALTTLAKLHEHEYSLLYQRELKKRGVEV